MIVGFNHNVNYRGTTFHVQTEDSGLQRPQLTTLLYHGGTILSSKKTLYADIIKVAMINLHRELKMQQLKGKMLLQIHDELLFEVPQEEIEGMKALVAEIMPQAMKLCVPLKIDTKLGKNWGEMTQS